MYNCATCGASFNSQEELMRHGTVHARAEQQYRCEACGASFKTQAELAAHASQKHQMATH